MLMTNRRASRPASKTQMKGAVKIMENLTELFRVAKDWENDTVLLHPQELIS